MCQGSAKVARHATPAETYADKVRVIFDGVDREIWQRHADLPREIGPHRFAPDTRIVTYVARGLESMRGFDVFMKMAKRVYREMPAVLFVVVGADQVFMAAT